MNSDGTFLERKTFGDFANVYIETVKGAVDIYDGPEFQWTGGKIPLSLWRTILGFFKWSYDKHKSEALVQLFYNPETRQWAVWAFPQRGVGMTVSHRENDPQFNTDRAKFPDPWVNFGSVHHHCSAKAFASGTDQQDELKKEGIHITVGELDKTSYDLHMRISFQNKVYDKVSLLEWFTCGDSTEFGSLDQFGFKFVDWALRQPVEGGYPVEWESRFCNTYQSSYPGGVQYYGAHGNWHGDEDFFPGAAGKTPQTVGGAKGSSSAAKVRDVPFFAVFDDRIRDFYRKDKSRTYLGYRALRCLSRAELLFNLTAAKTYVDILLKVNQKRCTEEDLGKTLEALPPDVVDEVSEFMMLLMSEAMDLDELALLINKGVFDLPIEDAAT